MAQSRRCRRCKWICTATFLAGAAVYAATSYGSVLWTDSAGQPRIMNREGKVSLVPAVRRLLVGDSRLRPGWDVQWSTAQRSPYTHEIAAALLSENVPGFAIAVPLWVVLALLGLPTGYLWLSRPVDPYACTTCGYNLTGNVSGICPECGTPIAQPSEVRS